MPESEGKVQPQGRVTSIDALRGFDMFWIIGGGGYLCQPERGVRLSRDGVDQDATDACPVGGIPL